MGINLQSLIEESLPTYSTKGGGTSEAPRKDFVPLSTKGGYSAPYQQGGSGLVVPSVNDEDKVKFSIAYPIDTSVNDFADSYAFLLAGIKKIEVGVKNNPSLTPEQQTELKKLFRQGVKALNIIKNIGLNVGTVATLLD